MITVVGSLNMDLVIETPRLPGPGETLMGRRFRQAPGGKGANQACAAARLGAPTTLIGAIGSDALGRALSDNLVKFGVSTAELVTRESESSGVAFILVDDSGQNEIVVAAGANGTLGAADVASRKSVIRSSRAVIAQLEIPIEAVTAALQAGREAGALTILNPAPASLLSDELLRLCDWLVPNESEAAALAGLAVFPPGDAKRVAKLLRNRAPRCGVLITLGAEGAWLECDRASMRIPSFPVDVVDTVGAGDTFVGAFAVRLVEGADPTVAATFAAAAAALSVSRVGAQAGIPNRSEVEALLQVGMPQ